MYGADDTAPTFCEQCGTHREAYGGDAATWHTCLRCDKTVCDNCWNLVADACLACAPFALPAAVAGAATTSPSEAPAASSDAAPVTRRPWRRAGREGPSQAQRADPVERPRPRRSRAADHAGRAVARLGIVTVAASFVAVGAVAYTMSSWSPDGGAAIVEAGAAQSAAPVVSATSTATPTAKPTPKPTKKPTPRPTVKPAAKPTHKPTPKPTKKPTPKPIPLVAFLSCSVSDFTVSCSGSASRSGATFSWTFGDGASGSGASVSHTYAEPGSYPVALTVKAGGASATDSTNAVITPP